MAMNSIQKVKSLRVQGSRSRTGCQTCKLKHVKCDEAVPVCGRCARNKRACHYEGHSGASYAAGSKFVVYTVPKSVSPPLKLPSPDSRALWHFQHRTLQQIEGPFKTELWSIIVPRLVQTDPIVRQAVMALSTLHEHYLNDRPTSSPLPERAMMHYRKARQQIISLESPDDFFDSILCASAIFSACEGMRGNFDTSVQHAIAGLKMITARKASANPHPVTMTTASEKTLFDIFMDLQSQVLEANEDAFDMVYPGLDEKLLEMPEQFDNVEQAVSHLQILINQVLDLYSRAEDYHETHPWIPSQVSPGLQPVYEAICTKFQAWESSVAQMEGRLQTKDDRTRAAYILLNIFALGYKMYLYVFVHGEDTYEDLIQTNYHILSLVEQYLQICWNNGDVNVSATTQGSSPSTASMSMPSSYSSHSGIIPVLFEIATRTTNTELRQKALQMLRYANMREGVWDGRVAASFAEKLVQMKQEGDIVAAHYVGYRFLITDVQMISEGRCLVRSGFKKIRPCSFSSFWLETIPPGQGTVQVQILELP